VIVFDPNKQALFNPPSLFIDNHYKKALMIFDDEVWGNYVINKNLKALPVRNKDGKVFNTFRVYNYNREDILLVYPSTGASASSMELELLIASGIEKIVVFGTCGAMDKTIVKNSIIVPKSAIREEGVSYHYLPPSDEVIHNQNSIKAIENIFVKNGVDYLLGKVWTTDAVYRETAKKLKIMKERGCIAVDMEMASLLAVAEFRGVDLAGFLITDDNIDGKSEKELKRISAKLFQLALDIVLSL